MNAKIFCILISFVSTTTFAGGASTGGGNVVICSGKEAMALDFYHASLPTVGGSIPDLVDLSGLSSDETIGVIKKQIGPRYIFVDQVETALRSIGPMETWIAADLKQLDDSGEPYYLPRDCERKTAAARQTPLVMYGDPKILDQLSSAQKGVLMMHEALYLIASRVEQSTSTGVRNLMRELLLKKPQSKILNSRISDIGGDNTTFPALKKMQSGRYRMSGGRTLFYSATIDQTTGHASINRLSGSPDIVPLPDLAEFDCSEGALKWLQGDMLECQTLSTLPVDKRANLNLRTSMPDSLIFRDPGGWTWQADRQTN
jgi:hypothetical protein